MSKDELRDRQLAQLKEAARIFLRPMERLPFPVVMEAMTGREIFPMTQGAGDLALLSALADACAATTAESAKLPYQANRPNDVSAQVEEKLQARLERAGVSVEMPRAASGRGGGYPDRLLWHAGEPTCLEVKVSREENIGKGSARNFFYQPTNNSKIRHSARHLLAGFAIRERAEKSWILTGWKIADLFHLRVKLKPEYNADNLEIYRDELLLLEGDARGVKRRPGGGRGSRADGENKNGKVV